MPSTAQAAGVALLLFSIGLEFSLSRLRSLGTLALGGGLLQVGEIDILVHVQGHVAHARIDGLQDRRVADVHGLRDDDFIAGLRRSFTKPEEG